MNKPGSGGRQRLILGVATVIVGTILTVAFDDILSAFGFGLIGLGAVYIVVAVVEIRRT
jgi:hypothetical protein